MHWIDWLIAAVPLVLVLGIAIYSMKYVRGVVDYLAAGRVAGRYVLTVGDMTSGLGLITLVAIIEAAYQTGFAVEFWNVAAAPILMFVSLSGFCFYRFRETKALSNGQFLEMRYNRSFRIVASFIRILSEMLTNAIGPAVAANFFIYFLGIPHQIMIFGFAIPTFSLIVGLVLICAMIIILPAGRISLVITDCVQGLVCYPVFVIIAFYIMIKFSWSQDIIPTLSDRVEGENFLNPFDISQLRDFNLFALVVMLLGGIYNRASFAGNDTTSAGRTPHEQKMASILATWRMGFSSIMCIMLAVLIITFMNNAKFAPQAHQIRQELSKKVAAEVMMDSPDLLNSVNSELSQIPVLEHTPGKDSPMSQKKNLDTVYMDATQKAVGATAQGNTLFQKFRALYNQMMMPMGLRNILPTGLLGIFCLMAIMLMVTTDDTRIFNASSAIIQDLVIPFQKAPMQPKAHLKYIKLCTVFVAVFFFCGSLFFSQMDYIKMFTQIMVSIWLGASGPIMVFGLYSRFGNTIGAYCSLIFGSGTAIVGVILQYNWPNFIYPWLESHGFVEAVGQFLERVSGPFHPYVVWKMDAVKCPVNSYEFFFLAMLLGTLSYVIGSLVTYRGAI